MRGRRLFLQRRAVTAHRTDVAHTVYLAYMNTLLPAQWYYIPRQTVAAQQFPCLTELIERDPDLVVEQADWDTALEKLPACVEAWMTTRRDRFLALLPGGLLPADDRPMTLTPLASPDGDVVRRERIFDFAGRLELATSVFIADKPVGWLKYNLVIGRDLCHTWKDAYMDVEYSPRGAAAAAQLAILAGLDSEKTTAYALDALDGSYECMSCAGTPLDPKSIFSWRAAVCCMLSCALLSHTQPIA